MRKRSHFWTNLFPWSTIHCCEICRLQQPNTFSNHESHVYRFMSFQFYDKVSNCSQWLQHKSTANSSERLCWTDCVDSIGWHFGTCATKEQFECICVYIIKCKLNNSSLQLRESDQLSWRQTFKCLFCKLCGREMPVHIYHSPSRWISPIQN